MFLDLLFKECRLKRSPGEGEVNLSKRWAISRFELQWRAIVGGSMEQ